ncbi:MAG: SurA N-terminal domain-containing protein [Treponema sp.]|jgi:parvulin-like peptidyl-prolyl isomerase|nr:SurA N-terminal domain-containing protein [Treponema sp.]
MRRLFFAAFLSLGGIGAVFAQNDAQTVAMVNLIRQEPITVRQLKAELSPLEQARGRPYTVAERRAALEEIVNQRLILQAAERDRIAVSENEIDAALRDYLAQQNGRALTDAEYTRAMQQAGANAATIRQQVSRQLIMQKYLMSKKQAQISAVRPPTDEEIARWYNLNKAKLIRPDMVRLNLISVPYGPDSASKAKAKEIADRLARDISGSPPKFDDAVLRGYIANPNGGAANAAVSEAGYVATRGFYVSRTPEVQEAVGENFLTIAFGLQQGEVSPLIENDLAYQFIKVTEFYPQKSLELDDIMDPANPVIVRQYIRQGLITERTQQAVDQALKELVDELRRGRNVVTLYEQYLNW